MEGLIFGILRYAIASTDRINYATSLPVVKSKRPRELETLLREP